MNKAKKKQASKISFRKAWEKVKGPGLFFAPVCIKEELSYEINCKD